MKTLLSITALTLLEILSLQQFVLPACALTPLSIRKFKFRPYANARASPEFVSQLGKGRSRGRDTGTVGSVAITARFAAPFFAAENGTGDSDAENPNVDQVEVEDKDKAEDKAEAEDKALNDSIFQMFLEKYDSGSDNDKTKNIKLMTFKMRSFKPLGCTAEECLDVLSKDGTKHVFVSKVIPDGNAETVGIETGDVIVGISGSFNNDVVQVVGAGLDKIKGFVAAKNEGQDTLILKVMRGSNIMRKHETSLVDLCILPDNDEVVQNCVETLYKAEYDIKVKNDEDTADMDCDDADTDCMLDAMFDLWGEETGIDQTVDEKEEKEEKKKPAPWSSRSSPSGTFVRDPKTGKMVNIDA